MKENLKKLIDNYLVDDGLDRDIVLLANQMGIEVGYYRDKEGFVAFTYIDSDRKVICINNDSVNNGELSRFILAYQLAEYVNSDVINFKSLYRIDQMKMDNYVLAKKIVDRRSKYKNEKSKNKKLSFLKIN